GPGRREAEQRNRRGRAVAAGVVETVRYADPYRRGRIERCRGREGEAAIGVSEHRGAADRDAARQIPAGGCRVFEDAERAGRPMRRMEGESRGMDRAREVKDEGLIDGLGARAVRR